MCNRNWFLGLVGAIVFAYCLFPRELDTLSVKNLNEENFIEYSLLFDKATHKNEKQFNLTYITNSCDTLRLLKNELSFSVTCRRINKKTIEIYSRDFKDLFENVSVITNTLNEQIITNISNKKFFKESFEDVYFSYQMRDNKSTLKTIRNNYNDNLPLYKNKINFFLVHILQKSETKIKNIIDTENRLLKNENDYNNAII